MSDQSLFEYPSDERRDRSADYWTWRDNQIAGEQPMAGRTARYCIDCGEYCGDCEETMCFDCAWRRMAQS
jgi:hypothetical protein